MRLNAASVPYRVYTGDEEDPTEVLSGPLYDFFDRPNPEWSRGEFWELTVLYLMLPPGEVFWLLKTPTGDMVGREGEIQLRQADRSRPE